MVKQATKYFPMEPLQRVIMPHKGNYIGMMTRVENTDIAAYAWRDRERRYFVASAGSLAEGQPYERIRKRETGDGHGNRQANDVYITVPMPKSTEIYFNSANKIDRHNCIRAECGIDKHFRTNNWATRVNFGILGMIFTDAYLLYKAAHGDTAKMDSKQLF